MKNTRKTLRAIRKHLTGNWSVPYSNPDGVVRALRQRGFGVQLKTDVLIAEIDSAIRDERLVSFVEGGTTRLETIEHSRRRQKMSSRASKQAVARAARASMNAQVAA